MRQKTQITFILSLVLGLFILGCSYEGKHQVVEKKPMPEKTSGGAVPFETVQPYFGEFCTRCHPSMSSPNWSVEADAIAYIRKKPGKLQMKLGANMPLPGTPEASKITDEIKEKLIAWAETNMEDAKEPVVDNPDTPIEPVEPIEPEPISKWERVSQCASCHGDFGSSTIPGFPSLNVLTKDYLKKQLVDFKSGARESAMMTGVAQELSEEDIDFLSEFYSNIKPSSDAAPVYTEEELKLIETGKAVAGKAMCTICHGATPTPGTPALYGQSRGYIASQIRAFKEAKRNSPVMVPTIQAANLTEEEIEALSIYFSAGEQ